MIFGVRNTVFVSVDSNSARGLAMRLSVIVILSMLKYCSVEILFLSIHSLGKNQLKLMALKSTLGK